MEKFKANILDELNQLSNDLKSKSDELMAALDRCSQLQMENDKLHEELSRRQDTLVPQDSNDAMTENQKVEEEISTTVQKVDENPKQVEERSSQVEEVHFSPPLPQVNSEELQTLQDRLTQLEEEKSNLAKELEEVKTAAINNSSSSFNQSALSEAEDKASSSFSSSGDQTQDQEKLSQLLKVKEKFLEVSQTNADLETSLAQLEDQVEALSVQSQTATLCSLVPLIILAIAVIMAFLPTLSSLFGTSENI